LELKIEKYDNFERSFLLKRSDGEYEQHCHFKTKKEALKVKNLIEINKYPKNKDQKYAMQRLLSEEEFKNLDKKDKYHNRISCLRKR
jgi:hypothetical protein